ncbi:hypothetical protein BV898_04737 [Hypsibius exemplaris]|uniref:Uncharacterized protein n=1 Tax=Hypsibius exemplaris TaxID=2072580 RepID=A0A1W0X1E8_HYPEX|nr:hypothetical protein BV898_04737 [Hypsibius exemplaris]
MDKFRAVQTLWGFSRGVVAPSSAGGQRLIVRSIIGGYNEDASQLGEQSVNPQKKKLPNQRGTADTTKTVGGLDEFPEFQVEAGKSQSQLHVGASPHSPLDQKYEESFAFNESVPLRKNQMRTYKDEHGVEHEKWDIAADNIERRWRDNVGRPSEERRMKEIKKTGFPEAFRPQPMPKRDPTSNMIFNDPIASRSDEMHLPTETDDYKRAK